MAEEKKVRCVKNCKTPTICKLMNVCLTKELSDMKSSDIPGTKSYTPKGK